MRGYGAFNIQNSNTGHRLSLSAWNVKNNYTRNLPSCVLETGEQHPF